MDQLPIAGSIEVITGCMFSGKTEELIRRVRRVAFARQRYRVFKHYLDARYAANNIASHNQVMLEALPVTTPQEILQAITADDHVIAIDEAHFFSADIIDVVEELAQQGRRVIITGLDLDFRGEPFGPMPELLARADSITKLTAVCMVCGSAATRTQRIIAGRPASYYDPIVLVGATEAYEPRCRRHHEVPGIEHPGSLS
jgi:thymidine kinase